jgi:hypothetical protein
LHRKEKVRKIKYFNQSAAISSILFQYETSLKLTASVEMYLVSIDQKMPLMTYMGARYILELLAVTNLITEELQKITQTPNVDWASRGEKFLAILLRARNSVSDPHLSEIMRKFEFQKNSLEVFNITQAIDLLSKTSFFPTAIEDYDRLSNYSHHNGTSTRLFQHSVRTTDRVEGPNRSLIIMPKPSSAVTLTYPSDYVCRSSIFHTAEMVLSSIALIETLIKNFPTYPFSEDEVTKLTNGLINQPLPFHSLDKPVSKSTERPKIGRNDPCPCGSGKKVKVCCSTKYLIN